MKLVASASYVEGSDLVLAHAWLLDEEANNAVPHAVKTGRAEILSRGAVTIGWIEFNALPGRENLYGNADGAFHFTFSHPADARDLLFRVTVETSAGEKLRAEATVTRADATFPFVPQPDDRAGER